jgi:anti-repressor protein
MTPETIEKAILNPDFLIKLATNLKSAQEANKELARKILEDAPKVAFANMVSASSTSILIGDLAKLIKQNGVEMGQNRLFAWMRKNGFLIGFGERYNMPTQRAMEMKLFEIKETTIGSGATAQIRKTPKVTGKGQQYFINRLAVAQ